MMPSVPLSGYVLAGGNSSRMGQEKALLLLNGKPLVQIAAEKLAGLCTSVSILTANPALARFAPIVPDLHPGCGPLSGLETALHYAASDWVLLLPVDVPFIPVAVLAAWAAHVLARHATGARLSFFSVDGVAHPALLLAHQDALPFVSHAIEDQRFKLLPVLQHAAQQIAAALGFQPEQCLLLFHLDCPRELPFPLPTHPALPPSRWCANLNTPQEFAEATEFVRRYPVLHASEAQ